MITYEGEVDRLNKALITFYFFTNHIDNGYSVHMDLRTPLSKSYLKYYGVIIDRFDSMASAIKYINTYELIKIRKEKLDKI